VRTSTAALAAALTTITPAPAALAATQEPQTAPTTTPTAAVRPAFAGHVSVAAQMTRAADRYARHRRLVKRHLRLAHEVAKLRGRSLERGHEARARHWSDTRLTGGNVRLRAKAREIRAATAPSTTGASTVSGTGGAGGQLAAIRACESGGNYSTSTGNGFYGAYQFTRSTWESVGGTGSPAAASPAEQDVRATALLARSGSSPWPVCGG